MEKRRLKYKDGLIIQRKLYEFYEENVLIEKMISKLLDYLTPNYDLTYAPALYVFYDVEKIFSIPIDAIASSEAPQGAPSDIITEIKNMRAYFQDLSKRWMTDFEEYIENLREKATTEIRYKGLPSSIIGRIYWIETKMYKKNIEKIGSEIIIHYADRRILGYYNIKFPENFLKTLILKGYSPKKEEDLTKEDFNKICQALKDKIYYIYCKDNTKQDNSYYEKIWDKKTKINLPYKIIENYFFYFAYYNYLNFFLDNLEFACLYLSFHYPFEKSFILENWEYLSLGCIYYSSFEGYGTPKYSSFGLSFNNNIQWDNDIREKYETVYVDKKTFNILTGANLSYNDTSNYLRNTIPLSIKSEIIAYNRTLRNVHSWILDSRVPKEDLLSKKRLSKFYNWLNIDDFKKLINENSTDVLLNYSIWFNTLQPLIDNSFCFAVFEKLKEAKLYKNRYKIDADGYYIYGTYAYEDYREIDEFWGTI